MLLDMVKLRFHASGAVTPLPSSTPKAAAPATPKQVTAARDRLESARLQLFGGSRAIHGRIAPEPPAPKSR